jgi:hypothetical protein
MDVDRYFLTGALGVWGIGLSLRDMMIFIGRFTGLGLNFGAGGSVCAFMRFA